MFSVKRMGSILAPLLGWGLWTGCDAGSSLAGDAGGGDAEPIDAAQVDADPIDAAPIDADPIDADPLGTWSSAPPLAEGPRQETAVVALGDELWVLGGFDETSTFGNVVEIYAPATMAWRRGPDLPVAMHHANAAVVDGKIYVLGFLGTNFAADGRAFVLEGAAWSPRASMPAGRQRGSSATTVLEGRVYLIGGFRSLGAVADVDVYDPASDTYSPLPPLPRLADHLVAAAIGDRIYAAGGRAGAITSHTTELDVYDPASGQWSLGPPMPTSRGGSSAAVIGTALYVFGGEGNSGAASGVFDQVERFDRSSNLWTTLRPMTPGRHGTGAAAIGGRIYVPGGAGVQAFGAIDSVAVFSP